MRRHLPVIGERTLGELREVQARLASDFETDLRAMVAEGGPEISCRKGCDNCCHLPVAISVLEGLLLYRWLVERGRWTPALRARCEQDSKQIFGLRSDVLVLLAHPCVLLSDSHTCTAYEGRPFACRSAFSVGDPDDCHPHRAAQGVLPRVEPLTKFTSAQDRMLERLGVAKVTVPISTALLLASRIEEGVVAIDDVNRTLLQEYLERV